MKAGKQSIEFENKPVIISSAAVAGPFEGKGNFKDDYDRIYDDIYIGQDSFEKAERTMLQDACEIALNKANIKKDDIDFFISGDLMNQIISSSFVARSLEIPYFGIYGACSSSMEGLCLASLLVSSGFASKVLTGVSSHNASSEKQYRYPTEYGSQKPPTSQWTVTGAASGLVASLGNGPKVTRATVGKVIDMGISDPFKMGSAMAPAAASTIEAFFNDFDVAPSYYDIIATGDLGAVGHNILKELLKKDGYSIPDDILTDCGNLIYKKDQEAFSGGSGCACSGLVTYGHFIKLMNEGKIKRMLIIATGALMSPLSYQQKDSIPCVAHAVSIEM